MKDSTFRILEHINYLGLDNSQWGLYELDERGTKELFGTKRNSIICGKIIYIYFNDKTEIDEFLKLLDNEDIYQEHSMEDETSHLLIIHL